MNSKQAKSIPMVAFLEKMGFVPFEVKQNGTDIWYKSPLRPDEKTPSFHVSKTRNVWYDFGNSEGGNLIDFVLAYKNCDVNTALNFIESVYSKPVTKQSNLLRGVSDAENEAFTLSETKREFAPSMFLYVQDERKINLSAIRDFAVQVHFSNRDGKAFFGVGMKNLSDGYEVRNAYFKGSIGKKDLTFVKGTGSNSIAIFEGMFDFFAAVTHFGKTFLENDILILNSVAFQDKAVTFIKDRPEYQKLSLFLDNDNAGKQAAETFQIEFSDRIVEPSYALYLPHKDFNDFLKARSQSIRK
jgi:hypothetical protein